MKRSVFWMGACLVLGLLAGCGDDGAGTGGSGGGTGGSGGAGGSGGSGGGDSPEVAACKDLAAQVRAACNGQQERECLYDQYAVYCASERTDVLTAGLDCLLQKSETSCRTFSDPSGALTCLEGAFAGVDTTEAEAVAANIVAKCPGVNTDGLLRTAEPPLAIASSAKLAELDACVESATDCDSITACYETTFSEIWDNCN